MEPKDNQQIYDSSKSNFFATQKNDDMKMQIQNINYSSQQNQSNMIINPQSQMNQEFPPQGLNYTLNTQQNNQQSQTQSSSFLDKVKLRGLIPFLLHSSNFLIKLIFF